MSPLSPLNMHHYVLIFQMSYKSSMSQYVLKGFIYVHEFFLLPCVFMLVQVNQTSTRQVQQSPHVLVGPNNTFP